MTGFALPINARCIELDVLKSKLLLDASRPTLLCSRIDEDKIEVLLETIPEGFPQEPGQTIWRYRLSAVCTCTKLSDDDVVNAARSEAQSIGDLLYQPSHWDFGSTKVAISRSETEDTPRRVQDQASTQNANNTTNAHVLINLPALVTNVLTQRQPEKQRPSESSPYLKDTDLLSTPHSDTPPVPPPAHTPPAPRVLGILLSSANDEALDTVQTACSASNVEFEQSSAQGEPAGQTGDTSATNIERSAETKSTKRKSPTAIPQASPKRHKADRRDAKFQNQVGDLLDIVRDGARIIRSCGNILSWKDDVELVKPRYRSGFEELANQYEYYSRETTMRAFQSGLLCACALIVHSKLATKGRRRNGQKPQAMDKTKASRMRHWGKSILYLLDQLARRVEGTALNVIVALSASKQRFTETWVKQSQGSLNAVMDEVALRLTCEDGCDDWRQLPEAYRLHPVVELAEVSDRSYDTIRSCLDLDAAFFRNEPQIGARSCFSDDGYGSLPDIVLSMPTQSVQAAGASLSKRMPDDEIVAAEPTLQLIEGGIETPQAFVSTVLSAGPAISYQSSPMDSTTAVFFPWGNPDITLHPTDTLGFPLSPAFLSET